ncbi:pentatricopeptide repeat-containing protein At1g02060, chloroplastic-like [Nicotiana tabacum]|uniref:Pentatricopeptide repeat-containing protein At1g02060, chloroplastic-like n=1 Tax=Nicotiana tabacum TaxID=4097 RepID=A0A1S3YWJ1_TOBAC|nr:PREDICTED: pentatricopeptide repeat-containing protein At1g02060, chloroplastic-like [Nicotiana tabacum]
MAIALFSSLLPAKSAIFTARHFQHICTTSTLLPYLLSSHPLSTLSQLFTKQTANPTKTNKPKNGKQLNNPPKPKSSSSSSKSKTAANMANLINTNTWSSNLESSLSSLTQPSLSHTTVLHTLRFIKKPSKALHFFNWTQKLGFSHTHQSYFLMLQLLGNARNLNSARNFLFSIPTRSKTTVPLQDKYFNTLIRSYGKAGLFQESLKVFKTMKSLGISPSVVTFNSLFSILLKRGRTGMVYDLFDEMLKTYGAKPDLYTFNILIRGFCMNSMVDQGFRFFKEMERHECEPDVITYNTIIDGLCRAGKARIAHNVLKGMVKRGHQLSPNVVSYTTLVRGYCENQEVEHALDVFKEMIDLGLKPTSITYNTLVQGLCEAQKFDRIKEILEGTLGGGGFIPDTCTFNTLITCHCNAGNLDEAMKVFESMSDLKVKPDSATYSILIRSFCQKGYFDRALKLFDELKKTDVLLCDDGCKPVVAAYNLMFEHLCKIGKTKKAEKVFRQLMRRGTQDPLAYRILIMGHCREGTFNDAHELLVLMLRKDYVPDIEIYESLIKGLLQKNDPKVAYDTLEKMLKSSHLPRSSTFHQILTELIKKNCASECASLVKLMLDNKVRQSISLSTDTVRILCQTGLRERAFEIVRCLYENGYMVNMEGLVVSLCQCRKLLEARELLLFSLSKDHILNVDTCSTLLSALCKARRASEAFEIYYELFEKGVQQPLKCLEELGLVLETEGRTKEAEFVKKRILGQSQSDGLVQTCASERDPSNL